MMDFDKIRRAVNSIEMSTTMKNRIIENSIKARKEKAVHLSLKRKISVACVFTILLSIIVGIPIVNKNGGLHAANFVITAYAAGGDGISHNLSSEKAIFELSSEDRIGTIGSVSGDGSNLIFTNVMLNITGENIESITYNINKGKFVEDVTFTEKENNREWLLLEKIYIIYSEPGSEIFKGIKEIGDTYTVMYKDQGKYEYAIAIPHDGNYIIADDIIISVNVKYSDGNIEKQDIAVSQESDSISLKLK